MKPNHPETPESSGMGKTPLKTDKTNRKIIHALIFTSFLFLLLVVYLSYLSLYKGDKLAANPYNNRNLQLENTTLRGSIFDKNGTLLASSKVSGKNQVRLYPYGSLYSQVIGYNSRIYGKSLLEKTYNDYLLNRNKANPLESIKDMLDDEQKTGNDLYLTLDHKLQALSAKLLGDRKGAVVAMDPRTGEILAMVSKPDYDPNSSALEANWQELAESENAPFLARATQGLYNPGSTFKPVISVSAIEQGLDSIKFDDKGSVTIDGKPFKNQNGKAYGKIGIDRALAVSSNVYFSQIAVKLGEANFKDIAARFQLGRKVDFDIPLSQSAFAYDGMSKVDLASAGIGQGKVLVTPLQMAMITSGIANNGVMMKPMLVKRVVSKTGTEIKAFRSTALGTVTDEETAKKVQKLMQGVVENGTGKNAAIRGIHVAGKTGTAENERTGQQQKAQHAWFICFAPVENPQIAVAVILEYNGSTGGGAAAPIAQKIMAEYLKGAK